MYLNTEDFFSDSKGRVVLDVRSPGEYEKAHIPGALSFPLFSDIERAIIGTTYKRKSPDLAMLEGLEIVGPKMRAFVEEAARLAPDKKILLYCWRGGKRSGSMGWLLNMSGFDVKILKGGYKAFRQMGRHFYDMHQLKLVILSGFTGSGKTYILHEMKALGEQVIDLEGLAHHKGSAFGYLGDDHPVTTEPFENQLFYELSNMDSNKRIWVENESRMVGRAAIPEGLWEQMKQAPLIEINVPLEKRVQLVMEDYGKFSIEDLKAIFEKIKKRLGGLEYKNAIEGLDSGNINIAAKIALKYYDKAYSNGRKRFHRDKKWDIRLEGLSHSSNAKEIIEFANQLELWNPSN